MNIQQYAAKPKLIELKITDPQVVEKYGEEITFFTYDVVGMSTYFDFFDARQTGNFNNLGKMMKQMILDDKGKPALAEDEDLPIDIAAAAINLLGDILGKSQSKTSIPKTGKQQK
jgi:hypothetical protein